MPLINVRRSSDNAARDIYPDQYGNLDVYDLLQFVGAGSGYVTIWYDQSGNGYNATQGTATNQPAIVSSGTYMSSMYFRPGALADALVMSIALPATWDGYFIGSPNANTGYRTLLYKTAGYNPLLGNLGSDTVGMYATLAYFSTTTLAQNELGIINMNATGSFVTVSKNNGTPASTGSAPSGMQASFIGNADIGTQGWGYLREMIVFPSGLTSAGRDTLEHNQQQYYGIAGI